MFGEKSSVIFAPSSLFIFSHASAKPEFTGEKFEVAAEQIGTAIDKDKFAETVTKAINGFQSEVDLMKEDCYILPKYTKDSPEVADTDGV